MTFDDIRTKVERQLDSKSVMASEPFHSGEFVQERDWTCPDHTYPDRHDCDCQHCDREWDCDKCATATWIDLFNDDGSPKLRELGFFEVATRRLMTQSFLEHRTVFEALLRPLTPTTPADAGSQQAP